MIWWYVEFVIKKKVRENVHGLHLKKEEGTDGIASEAECDRIELKWSCWFVLLGWVKAKRETVMAWFSSIHP
jgi:hypothetical protein